jgi:hypothetical protein
MLVVARLVVCRFEIGCAVEQPCTQRVQVGLTLCLTQSEMIAILSRAYINHLAVLDLFDRARHC